jgi:hypothetical protein
MNDKVDIRIINNKELLKLFKHLDTSDTKASAGIKRVIKSPFTKMRKEARNNLAGQNSIVSGSLKRGLSVGSSNNRRKQKFFAFFGGKYVAPKARIKVKTFARARTKKQYTKLYSTNHFHLVNSGTVIRKNKKGQNRGSVGKSSNPSNPSFQLGFADRAIKKIIPTIENTYLKGFNKIYGKIISETKT